MSALLASIGRAESEVSYWLYYSSGLRYSCAGSDLEVAVFLRSTSISVDDI